MWPDTTSIWEMHGRPSSHPQELKELYWHRATTRAPSSTRASVRCEPMNPSAPVTRILVPFSNMCLSLRPTLLLSAAHTAYRGKMLTASAPIDGPVPLRCGPLRIVQFQSSRATGHHGCLLSMKL